MLVLPRFCGSCARLIRLGRKESIETCRQAHLPWPAKENHLFDMFFRSVHHQEIRARSTQHAVPPQHHIKYSKVFKSIQTFEYFQVLIGGGLSLKVSDLGLGAEACLWPPDQSTQHAARSAPTQPHNRTPWKSEHAARSTQCPHPAFHSLL